MCCRQKYNNPQLLVSWRTRAAGCCALLLKSCRTRAASWRSRIKKRQQPRPYDARAKSARGADHMNSTAHWYYHPTAGYYRRAEPKPQIDSETITTRILAALVTIVWAVAMVGSLLW